MSSPNTFSAIGASPVTGILLASRIERLEAGYSFEAPSLPGHLLHYVVSGRVEQECNGRFYELEPGCVHWYHENEDVRGRATEVPWVFYSVNFVAPLLPPPAFQHRLFFPYGETMQELFETLVANFNSPDLSATNRLFSVHSSLMNILALLSEREEPTLQFNDPTGLWWQLEAELRQRLDQPIDLGLMERLGHSSTSTITRACHNAVGVPPMKRIKQIRMSMAEGLVKRSNLTIGEISRRVGYGRLNEFSRDYRTYFGLAPSRDR